MRKLSLYAGLILVCALLACTSSGPKKALDSVAQALESNNPGAFMAGLDLPVYAKHYLQDVTQADTALNSLNALSNFFGLGNLDQLLNSIVDVQSRLESNFQRGVASGELMAECRRAETPDCPWVPQSLREAQIVEIGQNAAIAKVTTPARLTSWLALRKIGDKWLIVGQAVLESTARLYAAGQETKPAPAQGAKSI